jgi:kelch-like protein 20
LAVVNNNLMAIGGFDVRRMEILGFFFSSFSFVQGAAYLKSVELYDSESNSWKLHGGMNYRRLGGGVGVIKVQQYDNTLFGGGTLSSSSPDDLKNRSLSKLVDL